MCIFYFPGLPLACINTSSAVGVTFSITFIISFSMGMLVNVCVAYVMKRNSKATSQPPSIPTAITHNLMDINQKSPNAIELESNAAYGTAR